MQSGNGEAVDATVGDVGEFGMIDLVRAQAGTGRRVLIGPGDDAAHVDTDTGRVLISTDLLIEGRHFRRDWATAEQIGRRAAAANLSDINAMGGVATALTVGLAAPADLPSQWVLDLTQGFEQECSAVGAHVVGGDMSDADVVVIAVTVLGEASVPVTRSGAAPGDIVALAGRLGWSGAGLAALSRGFRSPRSVVQAHLVPEPPYTAGPAAALAGATSMIDVSDGLLADLEHIARSSEVVIDLDTGRLEIPEPVETVAGALGRDALEFVLTGGEDFALVATFGPDSDLPDGWHPIGAVFAADEPGVLVDGEVYEGDGGHRHW
ncbi:thiamine-phosphate kinase [Aeromicrobium sp. CTD01-1L150]|uniref:thiamine-phosphate kinase n=1 Tax=Aeromicrobium sp. CTD01-1L150 TaxID=3341830 RepID=UPI0035BFA823